MRSVVIAGVASGVGKTTIACAIMAAFRKRGHRVQPFKAGPDYIDPSHHSAAAGVPSRNLDSVLVPPASMRALFHRAASSADIAVVEGVMGLFDGRNGRDEEGSTAHIAKLLGCPVVVVIDVAKTSRTAGAIALGCIRFDPSVHVVGFILNRVASESHARTASDAIEEATGLPVLGTFPRNVEITVPERHLGLVPTAESPLSIEGIDRLAAAAEEHIALDRLWSLTQADHPLSTGEAAGLFPDREIQRQATIAVARDAAFNFYYEDNFDLLRAWGANLAPFSPLSDEALPIGTQGVYVGGGFPEMFADELAANAPMHRALQEAAAHGIPIYGECGGLMYLGRTLMDFEGHTHQMAGVIPLESRMQGRRVVLGYRTATALQSSLMMDQGATTMGHEFHYSELTHPINEEHAAYRLAERQNACEGYTAGSVLASYVHLHFGGRPEVARRFVEACLREAPVDPRPRRSR